MTTGGPSLRGSWRSQRRVRSWGKSSQNNFLRSNHRPPRMCKQTPAACHFRSDSRKRPRRAFDTTPACFSRQLFDRRDRSRYFPDRRIPAGGASRQLRSRRERTDGLAAFQETLTSRTASWRSRRIEALQHRAPGRFAVVMQDGRG